MASIRLDCASVVIPVYDATSRSLKKRIFSDATGGRIHRDANAQGASLIHALDCVTMALEHGDRVGLVGHNGAGKTTLLRLMAGIYEPTAGTVHVEGHAAPLFDITLGMDQDATGYENIILRGLFLGLSRREIDDKTEEIAEFTELGSFLDVPLRAYSAGMRMRLAFAVSTSIDPDILLLDEGIGVGDAAFLEKANRRLRDFAARAAIIVLASHSEPLIKEICEKAVLMERGRVVAMGETREILDLYHQRLRA